MNYKIYKNFGIFLLTATLITLLTYGYFEMSYTIEYWIKNSAPNYQGIMEDILAILGISISGIPAGLFFYRYGKTESNPSKLVKWALTLSIIASVLGIIALSAFFILRTIWSSPNSGLEIAVIVGEISLLAILPYIGANLCIIAYKVQTRKS